MSGRLESALVIALRGSIAWESALDETTPGSRITTTGTLHPIGATDPFDPVHFQLRDRQLAYRDLITAAAIVEASAEISDVWNFSAPRPILQGPAERQMVAVVPSQLTAEGVEGRVRHTDHSWTPYDAAQATDRDLYGRDGLVFEILARACEDVFTAPPVARIDAAGTHYADTSVWPLAAGSPQAADISPGLPLNRELFRRPDRNLADRDNQLAAYVARLAQILRNPFPFAGRLYVQATGAQVRESEVYVLAADTDEARVWTTEPALPGRNRITYDKAQQTLTWTRERADELHTPQLCGLSIPGIELGQLLETVPAVPARKDVQFWRARAGRVVPEGQRLTDVLVQAFTPTDAVVGGLTQTSSASFTVPGTMQITLPGNLPAGTHRVAVLAVPNPVVEIPGAHNVSGTSGTDGGATYAIDVASGAITDGMYVVDGGSGILYGGDTFTAGQPFHGRASVPTFTQVSGTYPSKVRQYSIDWNLALPPGPWTLRVEYTNVSGTASAFGLVARFKPSQARAVEIIKDAAAQPFTGANGTLHLTNPGAFDAPDGQPFTLSLHWTYGSGQLHIRRLIFSNTTLQTSRINVLGTLGAGTSEVEVVGKAHQPETLLFEVVHGAEAPAVFEMRLGGQPGVDPLLPIQIKQIAVQSISTYEATPDSAAFQGWRQECLERCERLLQQGYGDLVRSYGTTFPTLYSAGTAWDWRNSESWMALLETIEPRLREIADVPSGSVMPGRQYRVTSGSVTYAAVTYGAGDTFYGTGAGGPSFSGGGQIQQIGAFRRSHPGHVGQPCLVPFGIEFSGSHCALAFAGTLAMPCVVACQPWMIDRGFYAAQEEFWMPQVLASQAP